MARIEDEIGISYRMLDHWTKEGYLRPTKEPGSSQRAWPAVEIKIGRMMAHLVAIGIAPAKAAVYARQGVVLKVPMRIELKDGKLSASGTFAKAIKRDLEYRQAIRDSRKFKA